jgi:hypothetical protein
VKVQRYKIQQDKGIYCLKGCDDGDLVDYSAYAALEAKLNERSAQLIEALRHTVQQNEPRSKP